MCDTHASLPTLDLERRRARCIGAYNGHYSGLFQQALDEAEHYSINTADGLYLVYRRRTAKLGVRQGKHAYVLAGTSCDLVLIHQPDPARLRCRVYYLLDALLNDVYVFENSPPTTVFAAARNNASISRLREDSELSIECCWESQ